MKKMVSALGAAALLAGCGGGGGGEPPIQTSSFSQLRAEGLQLVNENVEVPATEVMPELGSATFNGIGAYSTQYSDPEYILSDAETLSRVSFTANFSDGSVTGRAYDFRDFDGEAATGSLAITGGAIAGNTFFADISGSLGRADGTVAYGGTMEGQFVGPNADVIYGQGAANATVTSGPYAGGEFPVWGIFIAD